MIKIVSKILDGACDSILSEKIITSYQHIEKQYFLKEWKNAEFESGHFVEAIRRLIEFKLTGAYTSVNSKLPLFNQKTLQSYENSKGHESYRIIIPRVLFAIYCIRNKRGVGHISSIIPNHQDSTFVISSSKWILAEIIRLESSQSPNITIKIIEKISQRDIEGIWSEGDIKRILIDTLSVKESILFLLFEKSPQKSERIRDIIEYKNKSYFKKMLRELHKERLIEFRDDIDCILSPKGRLIAEKITLAEIE